MGFRIIVAILAKYCVFAVFRNVSITATKPSYSVMHPGDVTSELKIMD